MPQPRSTFTHRGVTFDDHGSPHCGCELCDNRQRRNWIGVVSLSNSRGTWFSAIRSDRYPLTCEEAADKILDVIVPCAPDGVEGIVRERLVANASS